MRAILFLLCVLLPLSAPAATADLAPAASRGPIDIASDRLEADDAARQVRFLGQVVAKQGDVTLYAREMIVFLQAKGQDIDRIEAQGDVRIVQGERVATGDRGIYFNREGRVVLTGAPKVHQGQDVVTGDEIVVLLNENRSIVKGGEGARVRAIFHPKDKDAAGTRP